MNDDSFRLTPIDVRHQAFARVMRGYDIAAVEERREPEAELNARWRERRADASERGRNGDADSRGTAVSFDLELTWPGAAGTGQVEPYVALGPALFVIEPDYAGRLLGTRVDPALQLGAKASAGVKWRLGKRTTLFGAYEVTAAPQGGFTAPGGKTPADTGLTGHDFTYGLRFLY